MKIINVDNIKGTDREIKCPKNGFISNRILLESDKMGYTLTKTEIPKGDWQYWHYKNHLETCYCISGNGLIDDLNGNIYKIYSGIIYVLNNNDPHKFKAIEDTILICVFNPPLIGNEIHDNDGSYK